MSQRKRIETKPIPLGTQTVQSVQRFMINSYNFLINIQIPDCILFNWRKLFCAMILLLCSTIVHYILNNGYNVSLDIEKCPFCYGTDFCSVFERNEISFDDISLSEKVSNLFSSKNVYIGHYNFEKVVLKKLGHTSELENIDSIICADQNCTNDFLINFPNYHYDYTVKIYNFLSTENENKPLNFKICSRSATDRFINLMYSMNSDKNINTMTANIWTTLLANVEPLLLQLIKKEDGWPVPKYYGACGRLIVEEHCGKTLNSLKDDPWKVRAKVALQLLLAAENFTSKHSTFRFYLTDISPDNIAVTEDYLVRFIDLENVIIAEKTSDFAEIQPHESQSFDCENCYAFSPDDICSHSISDHNFYSVCQLLLSKNAPWPMMKNGLLHSIPRVVSRNYPNLGRYIEACATPTSKLKRFQAAKLLISALKKIIDTKSQ